LSAREWLDRALHGQLQPGDNCLTFDGNLSCQRDIALPVVREFNLTAFWFVITSTLLGHPQFLEIDRLFAAVRFRSEGEFHAAFLETLEASEHWPLVRVLLEERAVSLRDSREEFHFIRDGALGPVRYREVMDQMMADASFDEREAGRGLWMDEADIVALHRAGHVIGMHSHTGPLKLADRSEDEQRDEYFENYAILHNLLDERPIAMSHPESSYHDTTLTILRELGIRVGFTADADTGNSALEYPRARPAAVPESRMRAAA